MQNYRTPHQNEHRRQARQAIDGFLHTNKTDPLLTPQKQRKPVFQERLRQDGMQQRHVSEFNTHTEGWHTRAQAGERQVFGSDIRKRSQQQIFDQPRRKDPIKIQFDEQPAPARRRNAFTGHRAVRADRRKQRPTWKKWALRGSLGVFLVAFIIIGILIANGYLSLNKIFQGGGAAVALDADVDTSKLRGEGDGRVNVLLLGRGGEGHDGADLTDSLLVASIDPVNKKAALVSIPRDMWVEGPYSESKINAVFANAKNAALSDGSSVQDAEKKGVRATEKVVENILGINIHYYGMIDFRGFGKMVDTLGGVTINVPEQLRDPSMAWENNWNPVIAEQGVQEMDGKTALMYVRSRYSSERGDFDRSERQRLFLMALKNEIMSTGTFSNPVKVSQLMRDFGDSAKTDFSRDDIMRLYEISKDIKTIDSIELVGEEPNNFLTTANFSGQSVVVPVAGTFDYTAIKMYIRNSLPDGYITRENAPIWILNGTMANGIAVEKSEELKSFSYNVKKVDDAPTKDYAQTTIVDLTGENKYTAHYLQRRFNVQTTDKLPEDIVLPEQNRPAFVIIIGQNETTNR